MKYDASADPTWDGATLEQAVHKLIDEGKRSKDVEFQVLMKCFGQKKITEYAKARLKELGRGTDDKRPPKAVSDVVGVLPGPGGTRVDRDDGQKEKR